MKKTLLAVALAAFFPVTAFADVVVYGKANVSLQNADEAAMDDSRVELVSNASRIGLKGGEEINSSLKVIYQFEYQTEVDDGTNGSQTIAQRNIYLGLQGSAGTIMGGHFDTPTKVAQEKVDLFNDLEGDITQIFKGEIRASNIVQYTTPAFGGGFSGSVAYVSEENDGTFKQSGTPTNGTSLSFGYTSAAFYAGIAADQDVEADGVDLLRAVARVTLGSVQLGALFEQYENDNTGADEDGALVSALWNLTDKWALKGQYGQSDVKMADGETASIGLDYKMTKNATLFSYATTVENELVAVAGERDDTYVGAGIDFKF
ncbi:MAG TPA: porin [Cellvibrio sp.]|jgi:predicted porin|uniref:porin n=1 Tax=Cellvibrio sp. TaxID=1965322 RepID=UPI000EE6912F|nr:porin [Cellvibrio sp.]HCS64335.1 porin [Cellvibrio sp.]